MFSVSLIDDTVLAHQFDVEDELSGSGFNKFHVAVSASYHSKSTLYTKL